MQEHPSDPGSNLLEDPEGGSGVPASPGISCLMTTFIQRNRHNCQYEVHSSPPGVDSDGEAPWQLPATVLWVESPRAEPRGPPASLQSPGNGNQPILEEALPKAFNRERVGQNEAAAARM